MKYRHFNIYNGNWNSFLLHSKILSNEIGDLTRGSNHNAMCWITFWSCTLISMHSQIHKFKLWMNSMKNFDVFKPAQDLNSNLMTICILRGVKLQCSVLYISHFVLRRQCAEFFLTKKICQIKAGQNNKYNITRSCTGLDLVKTHSLIRY